MGLVGAVIHTFKNRFLRESSLVRHYLWRYRNLIAIGLIALLVVDVLDVLPPFFLKKAVDVVMESSPTQSILQTLGWLALGYFLISWVQAGCRYLWRMYIIRASVLAGKDLRGVYTHHVFRLSATFFDQSRLGDLMSLATNDVEAVRMAIGSGLLVFADALFYLLTIPVAMCLLSPRLTLLACLPMVLIPWVVLRNERQVHHCFIEVQESCGRIASLVQEGMSGIRMIKSFAKEDVQLTRLKKLSDEYSALNIALARLQTGVGPALDFCMTMGMVFLILVGGTEMIRGHTQAITIGTFVAFQRYIQRMVWPMAALGMAVNYYQKAISSSERMKAVLRVPEEHLGIIRPVRRAVSQGKIEATGLTFSYGNGSQNVLENIHFTIEPGERVALMGSIGAGKTALLSLLPRLYPVERGMLKIDGQDVNDWDLYELRERVGYVSQEVFLFGDSVLENISMVAEPALVGIDQLAVEQATQIAAIHDEINQFEHAYGTSLGERGGKLSGGQRQRLTLARAIFKQPSILILDDALSSVDRVTEERILGALKNRAHRNTEIIAAHRIATVQDVDRILVLDHGKMVQEGTHSELLQKRGGLYWHFYEQQQRLGQ